MRFSGLWRCFGSLFGSFLVPFLCFLGDIFDVFSGVRKKVPPRRFGEVFGVTFPTELYVLHKEYECFVEIRFLGVGTSFCSKKGAKLIVLGYFWRLFGSICRCIFRCVFRYRF